MAENGKFSGREVVIVEAARLPVGRGHEEKGYYKDVHASGLLAKTYDELVKRAGVDASEVDDVVACGVHDVVIGGGVEHMGHISFADSAEVMKEHGFAFSPALLERYNLVPQGLSAEMIADKWEIPRSELDEIGLRSHTLAHQATEEGRFEREMIPWQSNGETYVTDQGIRAPADDSLEKLASLKPAFKEDGKITAGNSSQVSDGAAAVLLTTAEKAIELGLKPRARIVDQTTVGVDPVLMLTGPIPATRKILDRNGMKMDDIDLIEINEAFASVIAAWRRELEPDMDRVNVNGGAIALGH